MTHVAVGIIMKDGHVLACQRKPTAAFPLQWEFPGGKLEREETAREALIRELHEELAIELTGFDEFYRQEWVYTEGVRNPGRDGAYDVRYYLIHSFSGKLVNKAFEQIRWVTPAQLLAMDILEGNRPAVELLVKSARARDAAKI